MKNQNKIEATESRIRRLFQSVHCIIFSLDMYGKFVRGAIFITELDGKTYYGKLALPDRKLPKNKEDQIHLLALEINRFYQPPKRTLTTPSA